jgi:hypothetical protein
MFSAIRYLLSDTKKHPKVLLCVALGVATLLFLTLLIERSHTPLSVAVIGAHESSQGGLPNLHIFHRETVRSLRIPDCIAPDAVAYDAGRASFLVVCRLAEHHQVYVVDQESLSVSPIKEISVTPSVRVGAGCVEGICLLTLGSLRQDGSTNSTMVFLESGAVSDMTPLIGSDTGAFVEQVRTGDYLGHPHAYLLVRFPDDRPARIDVVHMQSRQVIHSCQLKTDALSFDVLGAFFYVTQRHASETPYDIARVSTSDCLVRGTLAIGGMGGYFASPSIGVSEQGLFVATESGLEKYDSASLMPLGTTTTTSFLHQLDVSRDMVIATSPEETIIRFDAHTLRVLGTEKHYVGGGRVHLFE